MGNGEILWRPLDNPPSMRHQIFHAPDIRGFGLLQRERSFRAYQDSSTFTIEPSVWVEPRGNWGDGDLHLVELKHQLRRPGQHRRVLGSENKPAPLQPYHFGYTLYWHARNGPETFRKPRWFPRASAWTRPAARMPADRH
jgi:periplasmic glucans biosynthesis protein